ETDVEAGLGHAGAAGELALRLFEADRRQVIVRRRSVDGREEAVEEVTGESRFPGEVVERKRLREGGVNGIAGAHRAPQIRARKGNARLDRHVCEIQSGNIAPV